MRKIYCFYLFFHFYSFPFFFFFLKASVIIFSTEKGGGRRDKANSKNFKMSVLSDWLEAKKSLSNVYPH